MSFAYLLRLFSRTSPIELAVALYLLVQFLGTAAGLGALVMVLFIPLQMWVALKFKVLARKNLAAKDKRLDLITEIMKGIRYVAQAYGHGTHVVGSVLCRLCATEILLDTAANMQQSRGRTQCL